MPKTSGTAVMAAAPSCCWASDRACGGRTSRCRRHRCIDATSPSVGRHPVGHARDHNTAKIPDFNVATGTHRTGAHAGPGRPCRRHQPTEHLHVRSWHQDAQCAHGHEGGVQLAVQHQGRAGSAGQVTVEVVDRHLQAMQPCVRPTCRPSQVRAESRSSSRTSRSCSSNTARWRADITSDRSGSHGASSTGAVSGMVRSTVSSAAR